ncbi:hypothetical protein BG006_000390 [Podila minutissima]|uniref:Protein kinase domain-containing protein n=1 Tax=Podila minutissima TaxID=64525 RepID=A0A9P5VHA9_9FUNG|nr:hypothetical protein BG006_000390 [Podila minutissima]
MNVLTPVDSVTGARARIGEWLCDGTKQTSYQILDILGYGTYGCIYLARTSNSEEYKAIKCLSKKGLTPTQLLLQRQEIDIHLSLSSAQDGYHPHIVDMASVIEDKDSLYLVMEYCSGGDLYDAITSQHSSRDSGVDFSAPMFSGRLDIHSDSSVVDAMVQITSALVHSHSRQVFHRDLKPENILIAGNGSLKLADFGLATKDRVSNDFGCGSSFYMAPEQQPARHADKGRRPYLPSKSDVWSLGIIFLNLRFGRNPWKLSRADSDHTFASYVQNSFMLKEMFPDLSLSALHFLQRVLCVDPNDRADSYEALELLYRIDSIVCEEDAKRSAMMEDCEDDGAPISDSSETSSRTSSSDADSISKLSDDDSIFHMDDDYGAEAKRSGSSWSRSSRTSSWSAASSHSGKSWSDMIEEEEMDFSQPVEFEEPREADSDCRNTTTTTTTQTHDNNKNTDDHDDDYNYTITPLESYDHYNFNYHHHNDNNNISPSETGLELLASLDLSTPTPSLSPTTLSPWSQNYVLDDPSDYFDTFGTQFSDLMLSKYPPWPPTLVGQELFSPFSKFSFGPSHLSHPP